MAATNRALPLNEIVPGIFLYRDTCNVYILKDADRAVLIDFGDGGVLDHLDRLGVRATNVLMTHHHRDQGQGLHRAVQAGLRVWAPHSEQELFHSIDAHWQSRNIMNNYNMRQDRFSVLEPIPLAGTLHDYRTYTFGAFSLRVLPTPGHTTGSVTLLLEANGRRIAFTGDLIYGPGKVWSLSATQWTYNGAEGAAFSILSLLDLKDRQPDVLLPSHGEPMNDPGPAIDLLVERLGELNRVRGRNANLLELRERPYVPITPHLLHNRTSQSKSYVVLSESGNALIIDYGYDLAVGFAHDTDRAARRPWLYSIPALKRQFGVKRIDAALITHFHDDHVAGLNMLREVEGTHVWAAESFSDILTHPTRYNLPCLWFDPITVDRTIPLEQPITWEEYTFTLHAQPGHTHFAVAISFEADGRRVLATGDQQSNEGTLNNYVYHNRFHHSDYRASAALYRRLAPDLIISGHWEPLWVTEEYLSDLERNGEALERAHQDLLPLEEVDLGTEGFGARLTPYQSQVEAGGAVRLEAHVTNPFGFKAAAIVRMVLPDEWSANPPQREVVLQPNGTGVVEFEIRVPAGWATEGLAARRVRVAADLTVADRRFGQHAEALIDVVTGA